MGGRKVFGYPPRPIVKTASPYDPLDGMADDRHEAIGWYLHLLVRQELARGYSQVRLSTRTKVSQPVLSNIVGGNYEPKFQTVCVLADYFNQAPWELVRDALDWWENRGGKKYAFDQENQRHQLRIAQLAAKRAK
jgi:transcriptional regulator with XRE-family HTH domain